MPKNTQSVVAIEIAELMRDLQKRPLSEVGAALADVTDSAVRAVPGAEYAGVTIGSSTASIETLAPTHRYVTDLDGLQRNHRDGPYLSSAWGDQQMILVDDLAADARWPRFRDAAISSVPVASILSFQLYAGKRATGALTFYSDVAFAFDEEAVEVGLLFATHTAFVVGMLQRDRQFRTALESRDIIGQAKGILMERFKVDSVRAFELLKRMSQDVNVPVAEVAEKLVQSEHPLP